MLFRSCEIHCVVRGHWATRIISGEEVRRYRLSAGEGLIIFPEEAHNSGPVQQSPNEFYGFQFRAEGEGEILGITGLLGSGRTELVQALFGYHKADSGEIYIRGNKVEINTVKDGIKNGIGYVPPERIVEGVFLPQSIKENISIEKWDEWAGPLGIMNEKKIEEVVNEWVKKLRIKLHDINDPMNTLSGGNQDRKSTRLNSSHS